MWIFFSLTAAICDVIKNISYKKLLNDSVDEYILSWSRYALSIPFLIPLFIHSLPLPELTTIFWIYMPLSIFLAAYSMILYTKALKYSELSIVAPLLAFTPAFFTITSPLILHESPPFQGFIGIFCIVIGAYLLNITKSKRGFFGPIQALFHNKGARLMFLVAFIFSIEGVIDKAGANETNIYFWTFTRVLGISLCLLPFMLNKSRIKIQQIYKKFPILLFVGLIAAITMISMMSSLTLTYAAYAASIRRLNILFSVIAGFFIFRERNIKERLAGSMIMILGVILITLS